MTDSEITKQFQGVEDFIRRELRCGTFALYAYAIDGLTSGGDIAEYVFKPISEQLSGETMEDLYKGDTYE